MRLSTLAALMILTTIMLSACSQKEMAQVIDNSGQFYGHDAQPTYSAWNPAPANPSTDYKYKGSQEYGVGAEVGSVTSTDLAPPSSVAASAPKPAFKMASMAPASGKPISEPMIRTATLSDWEWPVHGKVTKNFMSDGTGEGIAISATEGLPIRASGEGSVAYVGNNLSDFGNIVILRHKDGVMTSYAHAREILVSKGDHIKQGDLLGYVGKSGNVSTPQLHFGMRVADASVDPLHYLPHNIASR